MGSERSGVSTTAMIENPVARGRVLDWASTTIGGVGSPRSYGIVRRSPCDVVVAIFGAQNQAGAPARAGAVDHLSFLARSSAEAGRRCAVRYRRTVLPKRRCAAHAGATLLADVYRGLTTGPRRRRIEALIKLAAPVLDVVLLHGDRVSRMVRPRALGRDRSKRTGLSPRSATRVSAVTAEPEPAIVVPSKQLAWEKRHCPRGDRLDLLLGRAAVFYLLQQILRRTCRRSAASRRWCAAKPGESPRCRRCRPGSSIHGPKTLLVFVDRISGCVGWPESRGGWLPRCRHPRALAGLRKFIIYVPIVGGVVLAVSVLMS